MALIMATCAHANAVVAEHPAGGALQDVEGRNYTAVVGYRMGGAAIYEGTGSIAPEHSNTWFHIPVPTVSWLPNSKGSSSRAFLDSFGVIFKLDNCSVSGIEAWDGGNLFFVASVPNGIADRQMTGDWSIWGRVLEPSQTSGRVPMTNLFAPRDRSGRRHEQMGGLGISVRVNFAGGNAPRRIYFYGAGALWHDAPTD